LVNTNGDLIGINSAIQSTTGYYQGYGFAVPANLARKLLKTSRNSELYREDSWSSSLDLSNDQLLQLQQADQNKYKVGSGIYVTGFGK
jgi:S1-C subfamily serine protease